MARTVFWRSWSALEAGIELDRIKSLPLSHRWVNAHKVPFTNVNDIWMTTNGYDYRPGLFKKATWYAESYNYLKNEYDIYPTDKRYDLKLHFNPSFYKYPKNVYQQIHCWWKYEKELYDKTVKNKQTKWLMGMVLSKKQDNKLCEADIGFYRSKAVQALKGKSFRYYGKGWDHGDPNYGGEVYVNGSRGNPVKFNDARILMCDCKFVLCLENIHDKTYAVNYLTEKIFHGFLSASIPVYCGCWNIDQLINPNLYIDLRKFNYDFAQAYDYCEKMPDSEYKATLSRIGEFLEKEGQLFTCENRFLEVDHKLAQAFG